MSKALQNVMAQIDQLRRQVMARSDAPQLAHTSFDSGPGHSIEETDPVTGNPVASFGTQFDGSHGAVSYSGPIPPVPSPAIAGKTAAELLTAGWDGVFCNEAGEPDPTVPATMDFSHVEIHASQDPGYTAQFSETIIGTINTARGGITTTVVSPGVWYVRLVARSTTGNRSQPSEPVQVTVKLMEHTNAEGYTSTVTGQGLRVTRTDGLNVYDVIRLGTFGADFLSISDGAGKAMASISGVGDIGAQRIYSDGDVYANGRKLATDMEGPRGEVAYASHNFGASTPWWTESSTGAGIIEVSFVAERGRAYQLSGNFRHVVSIAVPERIALMAVFRTGGEAPTPTIFDARITGPGPGFQSGEITRLNYGQTDQFGGRFVALSPTVVGPAKVVCRVLVVMRRTLVNGRLNVEYIDLSVNDMGVGRALLPHYGVIPTNGTVSNLPAATDIDQEIPAAVAELQVFKRAAGTTANWVEDTALSAAGVVLQGRSEDGQWDYISKVRMAALRASFLNAISIERVSLTMTPNYCEEGMGQVVLSHVQVGIGLNGPIGTDDTYLNPEFFQTIGGWPVGQERTLVLTAAEIESLRMNPEKAFGFGFAIPTADRGKDQFMVRIPISEIKARVKLRRRG